jgi:hypothetical protein
MRAQDYMDEGSGIVLSEGILQKRDKIYMKIKASVQACCIIA